MSKTQEFLKEAFAGESQANRTYQAFAAKADKEGYAQAAKLFRAASEAEAVHANNHIKAMKGIRSTGENLKAAIAGEDHEYTSMYPEMIAMAKAEQVKDAELSFYWANEVEKVHSQLFNKVLSNTDASTETYPYYVCPFCGNTIEREPPEKCQVCGGDGELFKRID